MTREEANYYLKSSGFSDEQIETVAKAYTEPKTGHWIVSNVPNSIFQMCSECGFNRAELYFNYCPNCGARMESEDEE